jgi:hypothetical protein
MSAVPVGPSILLFAALKLSAVLVVRERHTHRTHHDATVDNNSIRHTSINGDGSRIRNITTNYLIATYYENIQILREKEFGSSNLATACSTYLQYDTIYQCLEGRRNIYLNDAFEKRSVNEEIN